MRSPVLLVLLLGAGAAASLLSQAGADLPAHAPLGSPAACAPCHAADAQARWDSNRNHACTPLCLTCHTKDVIAKHHPVDNPVTRPPRIPLRLTGEKKSACFTCHNLATPRYDRVRWKAESLFGRLFQRENRYPTYYLATRNDRGQLCLACH